MAGDIGDLDETQALEPDSKRHEEGDVAKDLLDQLREDAMVGDQPMEGRKAERDAAAAAPLAERDAASATKLERLMTTLSESMDTKIRNLSATVVGNWKILNNGCKGNGRRLRTSGPRRLCTPSGRTARPMRTRSPRTPLRHCADLCKMSAKMAEEVVFLKNQGSAASTVSGSTGSGGSVGHFASRTVQNTFVASRIELKGWGSWKNVRETGITLGDARELTSITKARLRQDNAFGGEMTDRDQGCI